VVTLGSIGQIARPVHDVARAAGFYRDILGLTFLFSTPQLAFFDCAGIRLMLSLPSATEFDHPGSILYFRVPDISAAHDELAGRGVTFRGPPHRVARLPDHDLWLAFFDDLDGNTLALMSEV
jgi:catechol 2,3-dioxygenase-like lactoylglutathione lyase family enzyme